MSTRGVVLSFPRRPARAPIAVSHPASFALTLREVLEDVLTFERTHAKVAWGITLLGLAIGLALQNL